MAGPESESLPLFPLRNTEAPLRAESAGRRLTAFPETRVLDAIEEFEKDLPPTPDDPRRLESYVSNALLLVDNGDYALALNILNHVITCQDDHIEALRWAGYCHTQLGDPINARVCFERLAVLRDDEESSVLLANAYYASGSDVEALECYRRGLAKIDYDSPFLFEIYKNIGNILLRQGDIDGAEENYNRAYVLMPHSDTLMVNIGTLEVQRGDLEAAFERFQDALSLNQVNDRAWMGVALVHREKSDFELAWGALHKSLDINPHNLVSLRALVAWSVADGQPEKPIRHLKAYSEKYVFDLDMAFSLAGLLYQSGSLFEARETIIRILQKNPKRIDAMELKSIIDARLGVGVNDRVG